MSISDSICQIQIGEDRATRRPDGLAMAIFERIAATDSDSDTKGAFSNGTAADYSTAIGPEVRVEKVQPVINELIAANIIMHRAHGRHGVTDAHVQ